MTASRAHTVVGSACALIVGAILAPTAAAGPVPDFQGIGFLPGGEPTSDVRAISGDGRIVIGGSDAGAFRWQDGVMTPLGFSARGLSYDGSVMIGSVDGEAIRWEAGVFTDLGSLPGQSSTSAGAVSADGSVIVGYSGIEAYRWQGGVMTGLGDLPGGQTLSAAFGVSADGSIIAGTGWSARGIEAFRWENGVMTALGDLPSGDYFSTACGLSADGSTIVGKGRGEPGNVGEAVRWTAGGIATFKPYPSGYIASTALSVSADGSVVVGYYYADPRWGAFVWDAVHGARDLRALLTGFGLDLDGWVLDHAVDISDDGFTIVGRGIDPDGNTQGWIATIPEPGTLMLLLVGGLVVRFRQHRWHLITPVQQRVGWC